MVQGTSRTKSCRTTSPAGTVTVVGPTALPPAKTPVIVYWPALSVIFSNCPAFTAASLAIAVPAALVTVIVPASDLPTKSLQTGAERKIKAPPSMKSPVSNSVGPGESNGSPGGGPNCAEPGQRGLTVTAKNLVTRPGRALCVRIV